MSVCHFKTHECCNLPLYQLINIPVDSNLCLYSSQRSCNNVVYPLLQSAPKTVLCKKSGTLAKACKVRNGRSKLQLCCAHLKSRPQCMVCKMNATSLSPVPDQNRILELYCPFPLSQPTTHGFGEHQHRPEEDGFNHLRLPLTIDPDPWSHVLWNP